MESELAGAPHATVLSAFLDASVLVPAAISARGSARDLIVVAGAIAAQVPYLVSYDRRHLLGKAALIRQRWAIEVVTPDVLTALVASQ